MLATIKDLTVTVDQAQGSKNIVDSISFEIPELSIVALVGGSGSGKTTTGLSILRLLPLGLKISHGSIVFEGQNLLSFKEDEMRAVRGNKIGMIFQEPLNAFNPVFSIGYQIEEVLRFHTDLSADQRQKKILELLDLSGIKEPQRVAASYPHQLSGGMRQRAMIAQAIATSPKLIIADEPTSNLDVTLQAKIIELFKKLKDQLHLSFLLITHDLGMVQHVSDHVAVMNKGRIVEKGETADVLENPSDDYTKQLMESLIS